MHYRVGQVEAEARGAREAAASAESRAAAAAARADVLQRAVAQVPFPCPRPTGLIPQWPPL